MAFVNATTRVVPISVSSGELNTLDDPTQVTVVSAVDVPAEGASASINPRSDILPVISRTSNRG